MAYTNPTFCQQSEYIRDDRTNDELPPPPQFQANDELPPPSPSPPPPPPIPQQQQHQQQQQQQQQQRNYNMGQSNPGFQYRNEESVSSRGSDRYCYLDEGKIAGSSAVYKDNYAIQASERRPIMHEREVQSRYEYIVENDDDDDGGEDNNCQGFVEKIAQSRAQTPDEPLSRNASRASRYGFIDNPTAVKRNDNVPAVFAYQRRESTRKREGSRYALVPVASIEDEARTGKEQRDTWISSGRNQPIVICQRSNSARGGYTRVATREVFVPPVLPDRNIRDQQLVERHADDLNYSSPKNNVATQKLHEILTTPRKPRSRSEERTLSPSKRQQQFVAGVGVQRATITPSGSPSGRYVSSPSGMASGTPNGKSDQRQLLRGSLRGIDRSPSSSSTMGPHTSTPTKEPSARRCLPLNLDNSTTSRPRDIKDSPSSCPASNCGRQRYPQRVNTSIYGMVGTQGEPPPRYAYLDGLTESIPMVSGSPRYQVVPTSDEKSVESAFIARTAVVPPLSPPNSEANTTLASGIEKNERRNAPLLLLLVGILTCGLALYLSWSQGRRYYLDSAAGCGACCALAGACRSLRRTWTGLGLAGLSALSCAGLLLIATKAPRSGTPLHDVTAGALCGVSLLGAALALLALLSPKCNVARHRRVHSWIPRFSP